MIWVCSDESLWEADAAQSKKGGRTNGKWQETWWLTAMNASAKEGVQGASKFTEALELGSEVEQNTLHLVRPCSSISPDNTASEGTDFGERKEESILALLKRPPVLQGQDSNSESPLCPNPLELFKEWFPVLKKGKCVIFLKLFKRFKYFLDIKQLFRNNVLMI